MISARHFGIKLGLENTVRLCEAMGHPESAFRVIHVAGTNGKGSVCAMLDVCLRAQGVRCGLFTSPHLIRFNERIRVNGEKIPDAAIDAGLERIRRLSEGLAPTFFEISTVLAFDYFASSGCDWVVLETGMGGRLDATNVVTPVVSVLTPIAMDHAEWLGDTIEAIASEKAGIIKPGVPVVTSPQEPGVRRVFAERAEAVGAPLRVVDRASFGGPVGLAGSHQRMNAALALEALAVAGRPSDGSALAAVSWPGRFQRVGDRLVVDGAHNPHASERLVTTWREEFGDARTEVIFGALADKDAAGMIAALEPIAERFVFVPVVGERGDDGVGFRSALPFRRVGSVDEALRGDWDRAVPRLATGSLYLVGDILRAIHIEV
jgi:dihydrofolate synthase/folylpolyglutamate synthase